jgi:hypothetical protein
LIDSELITYSGKASNTLTGCTRGTGGTTAAAHNWSAIVYKWDSTAGLNFGAGAVTTSAGNYATEQLVWFNPFLSPGHHQVTVVVIESASIAGYNFWFDGFVVGPLVGAQSIFRNIATATISATTNAGGYADVGALTTRTGISIIGVLGYDQVSPAPGAAAFPDLAITDDGNGAPSFYFMGAATTAYVIRVCFIYIGETI